MEELGRHFYDPTAEIRIDQHKLVLWPGVVTAMRNHENNVLLCVEITHKVLRNDSVLHVIKAIQNRGGNMHHVKTELLNSIVLTVYNRKTYKVDDIDFRQTPMSTFNMKGEKVTYADYYLKSYGLRVEDPHQPLLISRPKKKDVHRGPPGKKPQPILLIPEFCRMTGLSSEMRANFNLMRDLNQHLHKPPEGRIETINTFMGRLCGNDEVKEEWSKWQLDLVPKMERVEGKVLPQEDIKFGNSQSYRCDESGDFTKALRDMKMYSPVTLERWIIIVPQRDMAGVENFARLINQVSGQAGFVVRKPLQIYPTSDPRTLSYMKCVEEAFAQHKEFQLVFIVLPNHKPLDTYSAIKKRLCCEYGTASQCVIGKNVSNPKGGMSIATKIAFQMSAKIGAEPWSISIPLKYTMVIGFDVFHSANKKNPSVGAMVASTSSTFAKYFSTVSCHQGREQLSANMSQDVTKCLHAYKTKNQRLPDRIIMYRDGVGDGQLTFVFETEISQIRNSIENAYRACEQAMPKFTFIVVTKKIRTRLMTSVAPEKNPPPGTVVDDVITLPERFDFFLISQHAMQGTVSPTNYNVLVDEQGFSVYKLQRLSYKLTHMYFNWSGTVSVPATCQYAKKLAYLTGQCLQAQPSDSLSHQLYYL